MPDVEKRLTDLEHKFQALTENQEAIAADAARLPESLVLNFRILSRNLDAKFAVQDRKIDALAADVGRLKTDVGQLKTDVSDLKTDVGHLKTDIGSLKSDTSAILKILSEQFKPKG